MEQIEVFSVHAFVGEGCEGNLAGVCMLNEPVRASELQKIAQSFGASETAFVFEEDGQLRIRWFTPEMEVALCGHATLAAAHWLWASGRKKGSPLVFQSQSGALTCTRTKSGAVAMDFPAFEVKGAPAESGLLEALSVSQVEFIGKSGDYFLIELKSEASLLSVSPDFEKLKSLNCMGVFLTARSEASTRDFVSRCFFPKEGIDEDPVTGSAHCALGPYWSKKLGKKTLLAFQASKQGGKLEIKVEETRVTLSGKARLL